MLSVTIYYLRNVKKNMPDEMRGGEEHKGWDEMDKGLIRNMKIVLNVSLFFYLPISRVAVENLNNFFKGGSCAKDGGLLLLSVPILLFFSCGFP